MINLMLGDCLERMKEIESGSVDMILTDPPYGTTACKWDSVIPLEPMWDQLKRVIRPNGAIVMTASQPFTSALIMSNIKQFKYCWVWEKSRPSGHLQAKRMPLRNTEDIVVFYGKQCAYNPQGVISCDYIKKYTEKRANNGSTYGKLGPSKKDHKQTTTNYPRQILKFKSPHNVGAFHPTQKPIALMEYLIKTYTDVNETVLDFTMGSGSTGVACKNLNRNFIGIEMDETYFNIAKERINNS